MKRRIFALVLAMVMLVGILAACGPTEEAAPQPVDPPPVDDTPAEPPPPPPDPEPDDDGIVQVPRNETLYFNGFQWGAPFGWNPFSQEMNNPLAIQQDADGARLVMMETPYMYNMLDNTMIPLLADGGVDGYTWNADRSELSFRIKPAAMWSDGTPVTAHDAAFSWYAGVNHHLGGNAAWTPFIEDVVAQGDDTVVIKAVMTEFEGEMVPVNASMIVQYLGQQYILQQAWLEDLIARNGSDPAAIAQDRGEDVVFSGPYGPFYMDDVQAILIRNEDYWGQDASMWGQLPVPRYLANLSYTDNAAGDSVFVLGEVDVSQQFIANVQNLWLDQGLPISTYLPGEPYHISANMPTAYFNMNSSKPGLDNPAVRKAIAIATDYDLILANAMTNQSPSFSDVPRSLMNPTAPEQAMYNQEAVAHLQWVGNDIEGANAMLDDAGILRNPDNGGPDGGWREIDGEILSYNVSCPEGWSDWNAAMEIVAAAGLAIGIQMETYFPSWDEYQTIFILSNQDELDIFMFSTQGISPAQPASRIRALLGDDFRDNDSNWNGNFGQYFNDRALELIEMMPLVTDEERLIEIYTELVEIYLTEVPSFSLMYRPEKFHTVNESVWTGFTEAGDGRNVPPVNASVGYAIADLYNIRLVG